MANPYSGFSFFLRRLHEARLEIHSERKVQRVQFFFDFVQRLLAEVAILEHLLFGLQRKLADRGDVGVVQAVGGANAQLNLVDAHVQQLLELGFLVILLVRRFFKFHRVLVVADKHIKVMRQNGRRLGQRVIGRDAAVGPDFEHQAVIVGAVADARGFHGVTHAGDRREQRVNGHNANGLAGLFVFVAGAETASDLDGQFHLKFLLLVQRADELVGIDQLNILVELDVGGGDRALLVDGQQQRTVHRGYGP